MPPEVDLLAAAYRDVVAPRMVSLPMYNPRLEIEAVGFQILDGRQCGILFTPWFMNLIVLPGEKDDWSGLESGKKLSVAFPAGDYEFMLNKPEGLPPHLGMPLFTTVIDFDDQDTARRVAMEILLNLYRKVTDPIDSELGSAMHRPLSRRALLLGLLPLTEPGE